MAKMTVTKRNQLIEENRVKNRKGVQEFRLRRKALQSRNIPELRVSLSSDVLETQPPKQPTSEHHEPKANLPSTENCDNHPTPIPQKKIQHTTSQSQQQSLPSSENKEKAKTQPQDAIVTPIHNEKDSLSPPSHEEISIQTSTKTAALTASTANFRKQTPSTLISENFNSQPAILTEQRNEPLVTKSLNFEHSYKTPSALSKAVAKANQSLPSSPSKRKAVMARLLRTFSEEDQHDIIGNSKSKQNVPNKGLSAELVRQIRQFYERDDISRISPNVKDSRKFTDPNTGEKVVHQIRHLSHKLSEVYSMFLDEYKGWHFGINSVHAQSLMCYIF